VVQVVSPGPAAKVEITTEAPLQTIVPNSQVGGGSVPTYHAEFTGTSPLQIIPIPTTGKLHVSIIDGLPDPCRITIPVVVWPSHRTFVLWWLLAFLSIVGVRWQKTVAESETVTDMLRAMRKDLPHVLGLLALGFLIVIPIRMVGWLVSFADPAADD